MFESLQRKWKVNGWQLLLILCCFALGGSLTGFVARRLMLLLSIDNTVLWIIVYIILLTLIWPVAVLLMSIPFGQYRFFRAYIRKIGHRLGLVGSEKSGVRSQESEVVNIAIFASGAGSNAKKIIETHTGNPHINIALIVCNKPGAGVLQIAADNNIPTLMIEKDKFFRGDAYVQKLKERRIDFIVLAGFLWKIPSALIAAYPHKIINIHPALLPKYGGKGMYGQHVHEAVIANKEKESGISIHYVDELYDHGQTIFQAKCPVYENDSPDTLAQRIHQLEHEHYPRVIAELLTRR